MDCPCSGELTFYTAASVWGVGGLSTPVGTYLGAQFFEGPLTAPHFKPGTYRDLSFYNRDGNFVTMDGELTIVGTPGPVPIPAPEPAAWALMVVGFGAIGWAARRRPAIRHLVSR